MPKERWELLSARGLSVLKDFSRAEEAVAQWMR